MTKGATITNKKIIAIFNEDCKVNDVGIISLSTPFSIKKLFSEFKSRGIELESPKTQLLKEK
jgi:hypothetical protein